MASTEFADAVTAYRDWTHEHTAELLRDPIASAVAKLSYEVITQAIAEIVRLKAEVDRYAGRRVFHCTEAQMTDAAATLALDASPGDILRATDTGRELCWHPPRWEAHP